eukprot:5217437-Prymnesium_polylepis.2
MQGIDPHCRNDAYTPRAYINTHALTPSHGTRLVPPAARLARSSRPRPIDWFPSTSEGPARAGRSARFRCQRRHLKARPLRCACAPSSGAAPPAQHSDQTWPVRPVAARAASPSCSTRVDRCRESAPIVCAPAGPSMP